MTGLEGRQRPRRSVYGSGIGGSRRRRRKVPGGRGNEDKEGLRLSKDSEGADLAENGIMAGGGPKYFNIPRATYYLPKIVHRRKSLQRRWVPGIRGFSLHIGSS